MGFTMDGNTCQFSNDQYTRTWPQKGIDTLFKDNGVDKGPIKNRKTKKYVTYVKQTPGNFCLTKNNNKGKFNSDLHCKTDYLEHRDIRLKLKPIEDLTDIDEAEIKQRCGIDNTCMAYTCDNKTGKCVGMKFGLDSKSTSNKGDSTGKKVLEFFNRVGKYDKNATTGLKYPVL
jgi:hypothetical protein